jgi:hypothetical protein
MRHTSVVNMTTKFGDIPDASHFTHFWLAPTT